MNMYLLLGGDRINIRMAGLDRRRKHNNRVQMSSLCESTVHSLFEVEKSAMRKSGQSHSVIVSFTASSTELRH